MLTPPLGKIHLFATHQLCVKGMAYKKRRRKKEDLICLIKAEKKFLKLNFNYFSESRIYIDLKQDIIGILFSSILV